MGHIRLQKVHKQVNLSDTPNYDGTCYDYSLTVTYYPSVYFKGTTTRFEEWLEANFYNPNKGELWFVPEEHDSKPWEIFKEYIRDVKGEAKEKAVSEAIRMKIADCREDVEMFLKDALESDTDNDTVFIEVW